MIDLKRVNVSELAQYIVFMTLLTTVVFCFLLVIMGYPAEDCADVPLQGERGRGIGLSFFKNGC